MGRYNTGCGVGMEAFASPMTLHAIKPPFTIISGLIEVFAEPLPLPALPRYRAPADCIASSRAASV